MTCMLASEVILYLSLCSLDVFHSKPSFVTPGLTNHLTAVSKRTSVYTVSALSCVTSTAVMPQFSLQKHL